MAIPANVAKISFQGTLPGGEIWETGFWVQNPGVTSNTEANALAELAYGQFTANDDSGGLRIALTILADGQTKVTGCRTAVYTGGTHATYTGVYVDATGLAGGGPATHPNQVCLVASLRTALAGRSHRGRMYLPCTGVTLQSNGQIDAGGVAAVAAGWATGFTDWNASGDNGTVVVVSSAIGAATRITAVQVDSRPDVQRRRANRQNATAVNIAAVT